MKEKIFCADPFYLELLHGFTITDTMVALGYYALIMIVYYGLGLLVAKTGKYYGVLVSIILMLIPLLICRRRAEIGLSGRNLKRSLIVSGILGMLFLLTFTVIPGIVMQAQLLPLKEIVSNLFYYFVIIGLSEEISFRGFIQPRLYPLAKREWLMILLGGILFVFMHYPFQMAARNMSFVEYWPQFATGAPIQFLWHLVFTGLDRRYGNIFGSSVLHGFIDMSMGLFE